MNWKEILIESVAKSILFLVLLALVLIIGRRDWILYIANTTEGIILTSLLMTLGFFMSNIIYTYVKSLRK